jgi:hypothetical protein
LTRPFTDRRLADPATQFYLQVVLQIISAFTQQ